MSIKDLGSLDIVLRVSYSLPGKLQAQHEIFIIPPSIGAANYTVRKMPPSFSQIEI